MKPNILRKVKVCAVTGALLCSITGAPIKSDNLIIKNFPTTMKVEAAKKKNYYKSGSKKEGNIQEMYSIGKCTYYNTWNYNENEEITSIVKSIFKDGYNEKLGIIVNAAISNGTCTTYSKYRTINGKRTYTQKNKYDGLYLSQQVACGTDVFSGNITKESRSNTKKTISKYNVTYKLQTGWVDMFNTYFTTPIPKRTLTSKTIYSKMKNGKIIKGSKKVVTKYNSNKSVKSKTNYHYNGKKWIKS
jgi:hypothetical protein